MLNFTPDGTSIPISIPSEHGLLYGELSLLPASPGLVVLVYALTANAQDDMRFPEKLRQSGLSTLTVDLLAREEKQFSDIYHNVSLLARRLTDFLGLLRNRMQMWELREQPIGLFAAGEMSPVALRAAALRDYDVAAVVCLGGLIDLAGALYLRSLDSPLLLLAEKNDERLITSNRRAFKEIVCRKKLKIIPEIDSGDPLSAGTAVCLCETVEWFGTGFAGAEFI